MERRVRPLAASVGQVAGALLLSVVLLVGSLLCDALAVSGSAQGKDRA